MQYHLNGFSPPAIRQLHLQNKPCPWGSEVDVSYSGAVVRQVLDPSSPT